MDGSRAGQVLRDGVAVIARGGVPCLCVCMLTMRAMGGMMRRAVNVGRRWNSINVKRMSLWTNAIDPVSTYRARRQVPFAATEMYTLLVQCFAVCTYEALV